jgi:hypothetical protein
MKRLDENDTPTRRDNIIKCLAVAIEGLELGERLADNLVTDISSFTVHQVWEQRIRERHHAEHGGGPPRLIPQHPWLVRAEDAVKLKTTDLLRLGRQATERMKVALTARREAWRTEQAANAVVAAAASTPPTKRGQPEEAALVVVGPHSIKRSRRLQPLGYPRPEGKHYLSQGDICIALDNAVEGFTDPLVRHQHLRRVKLDMVKKKYVAMSLSQVNKWYAKWCDPATRQHVPTAKWATAGARPLMTVGSAQQLFEQRASTGERVKARVFQEALRVAANQALDDAGLASKPEVRSSAISDACDVCLPAGCGGDTGGWRCCCWRLLGVNARRRSRHSAPPLCSAF